MAVDDDIVYPNGIDATTGGYLSAPLSAGALTNLRRRWFKKRSSATEGANLSSLIASKSTFSLRLKGRIDPTDLGQTGWGVIFAADCDPQIREAMAPLLDHRQSLAMVKQPLYREYGGKLGYRAGESVDHYLARLPHCVGHGKGASPYGHVDPTKVPYYLLIVGDPEAIPYRFQYDLDVQYAVGRVCFDTVEEYAQYARNVVEIEREGVHFPPEAAFFAVRHPADPATQLSADRLVAPLAKSVGDKASARGWQVRTCVKEDATRAQLATILGGERPPALLFTASHGIGFPVGDTRQEAYQGALLCQEWPGPVMWERNKPVPPEFYFSADEIASSVRLDGLIAFLLACHGAGTPRTDEYFRGPHEATIANRAFCARLPQRMLNRGALAVIGHVDTALGYSFVTPGVGSHLETFEETTDYLLDAYPVGHAMEGFNERYAALGAAVHAQRQQRAADDRVLTRLWVACSDARNYVIVGDPAVRMPARKRES